MQDGSGKPLSVGAVVAVEFYGNEKCVINAVLHGGMGTVYQLVPLRPSKPLALKTFQPNADRKLFERECEIWLSLTSHPHIARALAFGIWRGRPAILAEWYQQTLAQADVIEWSTRDVLSLATSLATALELAHARSGVVHQDIKPTNVLLDDERKPYLSDFGIARCGGGPQPQLRGVAALSKDTNRTVGAGRAAGTPLYMAPELFTGADPSLQTDLYSLGVTLYEALTREHPYLGADTKWCFTPKLRRRPLDRVLGRRGPAVSGLLQVVADCLALDPADRPSDYAAVQHRLGNMGRQRHHADREEIVGGVVAQAALYRQQGRYPEAARLLREHLDIEPNDPILLNATGALRLAEGKREDAIAAFRRATRVLMQHNGNWWGGPCPDPVLNLASEVRKQHQYNEANELLETAWSWVASDHTMRHWYPDFGWMWLYRGEFARTTKYLLQVLKLKAPDRASLWWLTESAWLAGQMDDVAPVLGLKLIELRPTDFWLVGCGCLVAAHAPSPLREQLLALIDDDLARQFVQVEKELGLSIGGLRPPRHLDSERVIVRSIDQNCTGGKHRGIIG